MQISLFGYTMRLEILILIGVLIIFCFTTTTCGCCNFYKLIGGQSEGFANATTSYGDSSKYSLNGGGTVDTSAWSMPDLTIVKGKAPGKGAQDILNRPNQPVPLPEGEMSMFANTEFKPECCPNTYSNSSGCACMTVNQYNSLIQRGGNNVPYSEY